MRKARITDEQMVAILSAALTDGLPSVEAACREALSQDVASADVIINILARQRDPKGPALTILTPEALKRRHAPIAGSRYDALRRAR